MRTYQVYLIDEEVASHYFGKERLVYQLFKENHEAAGELKMIIKKQIDYITKPIDGSKIQDCLQQSLQNHQGFQHNKNGKYYLEMERKSRAELEIKNHYLLLQAKGQYDAETSFFEILRKVESSFLAIDFKNEHCRWLKPIKEKKFI